MENKFEWKNFRVFIDGKEIIGINPIKYQIPKHIQRIQYFDKDPFSGYKNLRLRELYLN